MFFSIQKLSLCSVRGYIFLCQCLVLPKFEIQIFYKKLSGCYTPLNHQKQRLFYQKGVLGVDNRAEKHVRHHVREHAPGDLRPVQHAENYRRIYHFLLLFFGKSEKFNLFS